MIDILSTDYGTLNIKTIPQSGDEPSLQWGSAIAKNVAKLSKCYVLNGTILTPTATIYAYPIAQIRSSKASPIMQSYFATPQIIEGTTYTTYDTYRNIKTALIGGVFGNQQVFQGTIGIETGGDIPTFFNPNPDGGATIYLSVDNIQTWSNSGRTMWTLFAYAF